MMLIYKSHYLHVGNWQNNQNKKEFVMSISKLKNVLLLAVMGGSVLGSVACAGAAHPIYTPPEVVFPNVVAGPQKPIAGRNRRRPLVRSSLMYPRASMDLLSVSAGVQKLRINVLANDSGQNLRLRAVNPRSAKGGRVYLKNNRVIYMPPSGYVGKDIFWYTVVGKGGHKHSAKVIICVCDN